MKIPETIPTDESLVSEMIQEFINQYEYLCECQKEETEHSVKLEIGWRIKQIEIILMKAGAEV